MSTPISGDRGQKKAPALEEFAEVSMRLCQLGSLKEWHTVLRHDDAVLAQNRAACLVERLTEQYLSRTNRIGGIDNDDVKSLFCCLNKFNAITDDQFGAGVIERGATNRRKVLAAQFNNFSVDIDHNRTIDRMF